MYSNIKAGNLVTLKTIPMQVKGRLVEECVVLAHKLTPNALRGGWFHHHST
jgi:hypothetical protein